MPADAKKPNVAIPGVSQDAGRQYAPEFVQAVKAVAAQPSSAPMTGEQAMARIRALSGQGSNGR